MKAILLLTLLWASQLSAQIRPLYSVPYNSITYATMDRSGQNYKRDSGRTLDVPNQIYITAGALVFSETDSMIISNSDMDMVLFPNESGPEVERYTLRKVLLTDDRFSWPIYSAIVRKRPENLAQQSISILGPWEPGAKKINVVTYRLRGDQADLGPYRKEGEALVHVAPWEESGDDVHICPGEGGVPEPGTVTFYTGSCKRYWLDSLNKVYEPWRVYGSPALGVLPDQQHEPLKGGTLTGVRAMPCREMRRINRKLRKMDRLLEEYQPDIYSLLTP